MQHSVNYRAYQAKSKPQPSQLRQLASFVKREVVYNTLLYPYGSWKHREVLQQARRSQAHTYTCFHRSPPQMEALTGPVCDHLAAANPLRILVFACSTGAEAYTLAAMLSQARPQLDFTIEASDLHEEMVSKAAAGVYQKEEVLHSEYASDEFLSTLFHRDGDAFTVKPSLRSRVHFSTSNLLDPTLPQRFAPADIVFAQNVLFHLDPASARQAFAHLTSLLKPRSALFIEGMDLDLKVACTKEAGLEPLDFKCREIYELSRRHIALAWWNYYYGAEPYSRLRSDRLRRYASIFLKS